MLTIQEVEMLGSLLARAGVNPFEAAWANAVLDRLRTLALEHKAKNALAQQKSTEEKVDGADTT